MLDREVPEAEARVEEARRRHDARPLRERRPAHRLARPDAVLHEPTSSYLAWIDFRAYGWGDDPQKRIVKEAKVALTPGPAFGAAGHGFARLNFACSPEVLEEGIRRIAAIG